MLYLKFVASLFALFLLTGTTARAATCDAVDVSVMPLTYVVRNDLSAREMHEQMMAAGAFNVSESSLALGMVWVKEANAITVTEADEGCRMFHVKVGFAPAVMYLAHELTESKCGYRHVLNHESEHIRVYSDFLAQLGSSFQQTLGPVVSSGNRTDKAADIAVLYKALRLEFSKVYEQQQALDSDAMYKHNGEVCRGALASLVQF